MNLDLTDIEKKRLTAIQGTIGSVRDGIFDGYPGDAGLIKLMECRMLLDEIIESRRLPRPQDGASQPGDSSILWPPPNRS